MPTFPEECDVCCVDSLVDAARAALRRRCAADPRRSADAVEWAAARMLEDPGCGLGPDGELSPRSVRVTLAHLSAQRYALDKAYAELARRQFASGQTLDARSDGIQQAYLELLRGLPAHVDWCCDARVPSVAVARMLLVFRSRRRAIDAVRASARHVELRDGEAPAAVPATGGDSGFRRLYAYLRSRLPVADHPKLERFVLHALLDVPHETIARESGMSHAAVRKESSRMSHRVARLVDGYDG